MRNELVYVRVDPVSLYFLSPCYALKTCTWQDDQIRSFRKDITKVFESNLIRNILVRKEGGKHVVVFYTNRWIEKCEEEMKNHIENELGLDYSKGGVRTTGAVIHIWKES